MLPVKKAERHQKAQVTGCKEQQIFHKVWACVGLQWSGLTLRTPALSLAACASRSVAHSHPAPLLQVPLVFQVPKSSGLTAANKSQSMPASTMYQSLLICLQSSPRSGKQFINLSHIL